MKFRRIFTKSKDCKLWSVRYPEYEAKGNRDDIFRKLFDQWSDTEYLFDFFTQHKEDLTDPFLHGISIDEGIDQVLEEREQFEFELWAIQMNRPEFKQRNLDEIFKKLHRNIYSLNW